MCCDNKALTEVNLKNALAGFLEKEKLDVKDVAKALGCPMPVLGRIMCGITWPSEVMLKRCHTLFEIGFNDYRKLSEADKEKISGALGTIGGAGIGVGASISAVSALGTVGLSAPGITSGLAALGAIVGGGMVAGIAVAAVIPIVAAAGGYLLINGIKSGIAETELRAEKFESRWERPVEEVIPKDAV